MSEKREKRLRKEVSKQMRFDLNEIHKLLIDKNLFERVLVAIKIVFKIKVYDPKTGEVKVK